MFHGLGLTGQHAKFGSSVSNDYNVEMGVTVFVLGAYQLDLGGVNPVMPSFIEVHVGLERFELVCKQTDRQSDRLEPQS